MCYLRRLTAPRAHQVGKDSVAGWIQDVVQRLSDIVSACVRLQACSAKRNHSWINIKTKTALENTCLWSRAARIESSRCCGMRTIGRGDKSQSLLGGDQPLMKTRQVAPHACDITSFNSGVEHIIAVTARRVQRVGGHRGNSTAVMSVSRYPT